MMEERLKSIKCFAVDHRSIDADWPYPYIRVGTGFINNCVLKDTIEESICTGRFNSFLGEWTAMWWIWKNLVRLGNPDLVGMTQYRRYFTWLEPNYGQFPITNFESAKLNHQQLEMLNQKVILSPD